jgi:hypothetical protein
MTCKIILYKHGTLVQGKKKTRKKQEKKKEKKNDFTQIDEY